MKTKLFIALALLSFSFLLAQTSQSYLEQAKSFLEVGFYPHAEVLMEKAIAQSPDNYDNYLVMFQVQMAKGDLQKAYDNLDHYVNNKSGIDHAYYDNLLMLIEDTVIKTAKGIKQYQFGYFPQYLNSEYGDFAPILSHNGNQLYFTSSRKCQALKENIFVSEKLGSSWGQLKPVPTLLTNGNESLNSFSKDGNYAYLFGHYDGKRGIYRAEKVQDAFTKPVRLNNVSSDYSDLQPYVFEDKVMFFTSNRPGSLGGYDIWVSENINGWQEPINLGSTINTINDEQSPFISWDGRTLFFSSNGHSSFGGFDIFRARKNGSSWTDWEAPINLGPEINTIYNERHYLRVENSNEAFISSDRPGGQGGEDIYKVVILNEEYIDGIRVYGDLVDNYGKPVSADINWTYTIDDEVITNVAQSNANGYYNIYLPRIDTVEIQITQSNYQAYSGVIIFDEGINELKHDIQIELLEEKNYVIENIYFDFDKATLKEESFPSLNMLVTTIKANPGIEVCVVGHTDNIGSAKYNKNLSERRAQSVVQYLIDNGVDKDILNYRGEGQENPKVANDTEENRQLNRRVEFVVTRSNKTLEVVTPEPEVTPEVKKEVEVVPVQEVPEDRKDMTNEQKTPQAKVDNSQILPEEEVQAIVQQSQDANTPFFTDSEIKIVNNKIKRIASEYGIENIIQVQMINNNNRVQVTAIQIEGGMQNDSFDKAVKGIIDGWFIPSVDLTNYVMEINPLEE